MTVGIRYKKLGYISLNVSDVGKTTDFATDVVGLNRAGTGSNGEGFLRCSANHHDIVLHQSNSPGLKYVAWEMESLADLQKLKKHCLDLGLETVEVEQEERETLGIGPAFRIRDPHSGIPFEFFSEMGMADKPFDPAVAKILRLGHVVVAAKNYEATRDFLINDLNFRVSDYFDDIITFMRAFPIPFHHSFALANSQTGANGLHHLAFMVEDIDDIGKLYWRMKKNGVETAHGPGRHPPSQSICHFFFDDDRLTWEFTLGMEEFPEAKPRPPRRLSAATEDWDEWGATPNPGFAETGTVE